MNHKNEKILNKRTEEHLEEKRIRVLDEQRHVSSKVSDLCRYIGFGITVACYAIFTSESAFSQLILNNLKTLILVSVIFAVSTIVFDYLQFLFGYFSVRGALDNVAGEYDYIKDNYYKWRFRFFFAKQVTLSISVIILLYTYIVAIFV